MDNSACSKPVKSFKTKLRRKITANAGKKAKLQPVLSRDDYLIEIKHAGCDGEKKVTRDYEFEVPEADGKFGRTESLHPELREMVKMFTDSSESFMF